MSIAWEVTHAMRGFEEKSYLPFPEEIDEEYRARMEHHQDLIRFFKRTDKRKVSVMYEIKEFLERLQTCYGEIQAYAAKKGGGIFQGVDELRFDSLHEELTLLFIVMHGIFTRADDASAASSAKRLKKGEEVA